MSKYRNHRINGFDSKKEAKRFEELKLMESAGQITDLQTQVKYVLIPSQRIDGKVIERECSYKADFVYKRDGEVIVEDVKPYDKKRGKFLTTPEYKIKRKLMLFIHNIRVKEV